MIDRADAVASYGLLAAGITHTALTFLFHPEGGEVALWFAGSGLALITLGLLNLARRAGSYPRVRQLSAAGNLVGVAYMLIVTAMLSAPHVMLILGMLVIATIRSLVASAPQSAAR
ncbi:MAG TPA: hypothetical protein VFU22_06530 [Roseiflexaceae bacterium]|nr:hypothetical protein [Roseiflexaceae bacterium]